MVPIYNNAIDFMTDISYLYDIICKPCSDERIEFYKEMFSKYVSQKNMNIFDMACCTGETACCLGEKGYHISGIDLSPGMIEEAVKKCERRNVKVSFAVDDMRSVNTGKHLYDAVYNNCLEWLETFEDLEMTIRSANRLLKSKGIVILDLPNASKFLESCRPFYASMANVKDGFIYKLTRYDNKSDRSLVSSQTYIHIDRANSAQYTYTCNLKWRLHSDEEIENLLQKYNFTIVHKSGDYGKTPFENSGFIQIIGRRE